MLHKHDVGYVNKLNGKQERFSFRKYSFGLASVLLGTALFLVNGNTVHAETTNKQESSTLTQKNQNEGRTLSQPSSDTIQSTASSNNEEKSVVNKQTTTDAIINLEKQKNDLTVSYSNMPAKDNTKTSQTETQTVTRNVYTKLPGQDPELLTTQTGTTSHSRFLIKVESGYQHYNDNNLSRLQEVDGQSVSQYRNQITNYQYQTDDPNFVTYTPWINRNGDHTVVNVDPTLDGTDSKWYENTISDMSVWGNWSNWTPVTFDKVQAPDKQGYSIIDPTAGDKMTFTNGNFVTNPHIVVTYQYQPEKTQDTETKTVKRTIYTQLPGKEAVEYKQQSVDSSRTRSWIEVQSGYENQDQIYSNVGRKQIYFPKGVETTLGKNDGYQTFGYRYTPFSRNRIINYAYSENNPNYITYTKWYNFDSPRTLAYQNKNTLGTLVPTQSGWSEYSDWTGKFDAVKAPEIAGYTVTNPDAASEVTDANKDLTATFVYTANKHNQIINYVDGNGTTVGTQTVPGKTGEDVPFTANIPDGYWTDDKIPNEVTFGTDDPAPITVKVIKKETSNGDVANTDKLPTKNVIVYKDSNGDVVGTEEVEGTPGDKVKPNIPDGYWNGDVTDITIPENGIVEVTVVKKETSNGDVANTDKLPIKNIIIYKDSNGDVVGTQEVTGKPGDKVTPKLPEGYISVDTPDLVIPKDGTPIVVNVVKEEIAKGPTENHEGKAYDPIELNRPDSDSEKSTSSDSVTQENVNEDTPIKPAKLETKSATVHAYADIEDNISDKAKTLPQTGVQADKLGLLGLAIASVGALLGLAGTKKRKN